MSRPFLARYGVAAAAVALVFLLKAPIEALVGSGPPLILLVPAVTVAAWYGGLGPGLFATAAGALICIYYYFPPIGSFRVGRGNDLFRLAAFLLDGALTSLLMGRLHAAMRRSAGVAAEVRLYRETLRRSEERLQALIDNCPALIYLKDNDGRYLLINRPLEALLGITGQQAVGKTDFDLFPRDAAAAYREHDRLVMEAGRAMEWEDILDGAGGPRTYLTIKFPLVGAAGRAYAVGGFSTDITERKRAERTLRESEERFRSLSACSPVGIFLTDVAGSTTYTNPRCQEIFGFRAEEALGEGWARFIHPDDHERVLGSWAECSRNGRAFSLEYRTAGRRGTVRWVRDRTAPVHSDRGELVGHVGTVEDITDLREAQRRAVQAERLAAIGQMVAGLAHESRNALQRGQACLEMLALRLKDRPEALDLLAGIQQAQDDLHRLYEEVRGYAAPIRLDRRATCLRQALHEAWDRLTPMRQGREARLRESCATEPVCEADHFRLVQVFRNVLDNALAAGCAPVEIGVDWSAADLDGRAAVRVAVRDNGPGLTGEQRRNLFEPFYTTKTQGTGLGLAIARRIVEAHGGRIEAGPDGGPGATILITLPRGSS